VNVIVFYPSAAYRQKCQQLIMKPHGNVAAVDNTHVKRVAFTGCHSALHYTVEMLKKITIQEKNQVGISEFNPTSQIFSKP
jgi:aspartate/tyrosine/aromatic aminotransferase